MEITKCVCGKKFVPGDMVHEVPSNVGTRLLCEKCYQVWSDIQA